MYDVIYMYPLRADYLGLDSQQACYFLGKITSPAFSYHMINTYVVWTSFPQ